MRHFYRDITVSLPREIAFAWFEQPNAFKRLLPPWEDVTVALPPTSLQDGAEAEMWVPVLPPFPIKLPWRARHENYQPGKQFEDRQRYGPFAYWHHRHRFESVDESTTQLIDDIDYELPLIGGLPIVGDFVDHWVIRPKLERLFQYRHNVLAHDLPVWFSSRSKQRPMKILISGANGLVGKSLVPFLTSQGHEVVRLSRLGSSKTPDVETIYWNPRRKQLDPSQFEGFDVVIHLAGESIIGRWTEDKKRAIYESRIQSTKLLAETLAGLTNKPKTFICASAIGYYGHTGELEVTDHHSHGKGFLADTCVAWENACESAKASGIRVANTRFGIILSPRGGALAAMLPPFLMGLGTILGNGQQYMSWISIDDVVGSIHHVLTTETISGPVNVVAPTPVTNKIFTKTLCKVIWRPCYPDILGAPVPIFARAVLGEMADALLLDSCRVSPHKLLASGYEFRHPGLEGALRHLLGA